MYDQTALYLTPRPSKNPIFVSDIEIIMTFTLFDSFLLLGAGQGLFVSFLLYRRKVSNRAAANYLLALVLLVSLLLFFKVGFQSEWINYLGDVILLPDVILFIFGPCIWLFVRELLRLPKLTSRQLALHALPAFIHIFVFNTVLGQNLVGNWDFLTVPQIIFAFYSIEFFAISSLLGYLLASFRLVQTHRSQLKSTPTAARFLPVFFRIGLLLAGSWAISFLYHLVVFDPEYLAYQIFWFLLVGYIYWLAYTVLLHTELFDLPPAPKTITSDDEQLVDRIKAFMDEEKPYLEPTIKLADLAEMLQLPRHELSRLLNHGFGQSFFDFINSYRIRDFIALRNDPRESGKSILQLAYQVGFNSKSAFNRAFRKMTGVSPSDYPSFRKENA